MVRVLSALKHAIKQIDLSSGLRRVGKRQIVGIQAPGHRAGFASLHRSEKSEQRKATKERAVAEVQMPEPKNRKDEWSVESSLAGAGRFSPQTFSLSSFSIATAMPFVSGPTASTRGPLIGKGLYGAGPFRFDPWEMYKEKKISSMSGILMGGVGEGKSSLAKSIAVRFILHGRKLAVMTDRKGEWSEIVRHCGGAVIEVGPNNVDARINPLDPGTRPSKLPTGMPMTDEGWESMVRARRMTLLKTLVGILTIRPMEPEDDVALSQVLDDAVDKYGSENVVIPHLIEFLQHPAVGMETTLHAAYTKLGYAFESFRKGSLKKMFDSETTVNFDASLPAVSVDTSAVSGYSSEVKRVVAACVGTWVEAMVTNPDGGQRMCVYEEGWDNIDSEADLQRMVDAWKLARHYGIFNLLVIHKLGDLDMAGDTGSRMNAMAHSLLADAGIKIIYRQDESEMKHMVEKIGLSDRECDIIRSLSKGKGLWRINTNSYSVHNILTEAELKLFNTDDRITEGLNEDVDWVVGA